MKRIDSGSMSRRDFMKAGATAAVVLPLVGSLVGATTARAEDEKLVSDLPDQAAMVGALQYTNESAKPDQNCAGCQLYVAGQGETGKCQLFPVGLVSAKGWCASWTAKVT